MFGERFSFVALGIIIGLGIALVHVTAIAYFGGTLNRHGNPSEQAKYCGDLYDCDQLNRPIDSTGAPLSGEEIGALKASEKPGDAHYYESQDLRAQKFMASSTDTLVRLTFVSIFLSVVGAVAVIWTLREARDSNVITQNVAIAQLRAYVILDGIDATRMSAPHMANKPVRVFVNWKNLGQTQTKGLKSDLNFELFPGCDPPADFEFPPSDDIRRGFLGASETSHDISIEIPPETVASAKGGGFRLFLWGWVEYNDTFPETPRRRTEFCVFLEHVGGKHIFHPHTHERHNGHDEDCLKMPITTA